MLILEHTYRSRISKVLVVRLHKLHMGITTLINTSRKDLHLGYPCKPKLSLFRKKSVTSCVGVVNMPPSTKRRTIWGKKTFHNARIIRHWLTCYPFFTVWMPHTAVKHLFPVNSALYLQESQTHLLSALTKECVLWNQWMQANVNTVTTSAVTPATWLLD